MTKEGISYQCGCWYEGDPRNHPRNCPTHNKPWRMKVRKDEYGLITDESWEDNLYEEA